jgi:non-ribosomal peptide synthetase component F
VSDPIFIPSAEQADASNLRRFIAANRRRLDGDDYASLYRWSIARPEEFWAAVWDFCGIVAQAPYEAVLRDGNKMPGARWFEGARLNYAANLLACPQRGAAIVFGNERGERLELSWDELRRQVAGVAATLRELGVQRGDRVAGFIANRPEAVVAMLSGIRRRSRSRPVRANRTESVIRDRRLLLQRQEHRLAACRSHDCSAAPDAARSGRRALPQRSTGSCRPTGGQAFR